MHICSCLASRHFHGHRDQLPSPILVNASAQVYAPFDPAPVYTIDHTGYYMFSVIGSPSVISSALMSD